MILLDLDNGTFTDFALEKFAERITRVAVGFDDNNQPILPTETLEESIFESDYPSDPSFFRDLFCSVE